MLFQCIVGNAITIIAISLYAASLQGKGSTNGGVVVGCALYVIALFLVWLETILVAYLIGGAM